MFIFSVLNVKKAFERTNERETQEKKKKMKKQFYVQFNFIKIYTQKKQKKQKPIIHNKKRQ